VASRKNHVGRGGPVFFRDRSAQIHGRAQRPLQRKRSAFTTQRSAHERCVLWAQLIEGFKQKYGFFSRQSFNA